MGFGDDDKVSTGAPPSLISRFWHSLKSKSFWESATKLEFWEQGCLGRSLAAGTIVGTIAGIHRYRNVRSIPLMFERGALGFLFGSSINYFGCRRVMDEVWKQHGPGASSSQKKD